MFDINALLNPLAQENPFNYFPSPIWGGGLPGQGGKGMDWNKISGLLGGMGDMWGQEQAWSPPTAYASPQSPYWNAIGFPTWLFGDALLGGVMGGVR